VQTASFIGVVVVLPFEQVANLGPLGRCARRKIGHTADQYDGRDGRLRYLHCVLSIGSQIVEMGWVGGRPVPSIPSLKVVCVLSTEFCP